MERGEGTVPLSDLSNKENLSFILRSSDKSMSKEKQYLSNSSFYKHVNIG